MSYKSKIQKRTVFFTLVSLIFLVLTVSIVSAESPAERKVRFVVTDAKTGAAIEGAIVSGSSVHGIFIGNTDENGEVTFDMEVNTTYEYTVSATCHRTKDGSFTLPAGEGPYVINVALEPIPPHPEFPLGVEVATGIGLMVPVVYICLRKRKPSQP